MNKRKAKIIAPKATMTFDSCTFSTNIPSLSQETTSAIIALAQAVQENAQAITAIANALKTPYGDNIIGVNISNKDEAK